MCKGCHRIEACNKHVVIYTPRSRHLRRLRPVGMFGALARQLDLEKRRMHRLEVVRFTAEKEKGKNLKKRLVPTNFMKKIVSDIHRNNFLMFGLTDLSFRAQ